MTLPDFLELKSWTVSFSSSQWLAIVMESGFVHLLNGSWLASVTTAALCALTMSDYHRQKYLKHFSTTDCVTKTSGHIFQCQHTAETWGFGAVLFYNLWLCNFYNFPVHYVTPCAPFHHLKEPFLTNNPILILYLHKGVNTNHETISGHNQQDTYLIKIKTNLMPFEQQIHCQNSMPSNHEVCQWGGAPQNTVFSVREQSCTQAQMHECLCACEPVSLCSPLK